MVLQLLKGLGLRNEFPPFRSILRLSPPSSKSHKPYIIFPINMPWCFFSVRSVRLLLVLGFCTIGFFPGWGCKPHAQPPTWRTRSLNFYPPETGWPSCTLRHWVSRVPRDRHFPYSPMWAPEGLHYHYKSLYVGFEIWLPAYTVLKMAFQIEKIKNAL
jgi:hypothetical protein